MEKDVNKSALTGRRTGSDLLRGGCCRRTGRRSFQPRTVSIGLGVEGPIRFPVALKSPGIYMPIFGGGLWGIPFGLLIEATWNRLYLFGFLYFIAPLLATFLFFLPMGGAGFFGLKQAGPMFPLYVVLVNLPFGIVTALTARAIIGTKP